MCVFVFVCVCVCVCQAYMVCIEGDVLVSEESSQQKLRTHEALRLVGSDNLVVTAASEGAHVIVFEMKEAM